MIDNYGWLLKDGASIVKKHKIFLFYQGKKVAKLNKRDLAELRKRFSFYEIRHRNILVLRVGGVL